MKPAAQKGRLNSDNIRLAADSVQNRTNAFQATAKVAEYNVSPAAVSQSTSLLCAAQSSIGASDSLRDCVAVCQ